MGTAYCLQYMHDLNPPVAVTNFKSEDVFLTDDYAAKVWYIGTFQQNNNQLLAAQVLTFDRLTDS